MFIVIENSDLATERALVSVWHTALTVLNLTWFLLLLELER